MTTPAIVQGEVVEGAYETRPLRFFTFVQNNSGGDFLFDRYHGITGYVIVQARDYVEANERAQNIGLYFDGVETGSDCPCCGDRWYPLSAHDKGDDQPLIYGQPPEEYEGYSWMGSKPETFIHRYDGSIETVYAASQETLAGVLVGA